MVFLKLEIIDLEQGITNLYHGCLVVVEIKGAIEIVYAVNNFNSLCNRGPADVTEMATRARIAMPKVSFMETALTINKIPAKKNRKMNSYVTDISQIFGPNCIEISGKRLNP